MASNVTNFGDTNIKSQIQSCSGRLLVDEDSKKPINRTIDYQFLDKMVSGQDSAKDDKNPDMIDSTRTWSRYKWSLPDG